MSCRFLLLIPWPEMSKSHHSRGAPSPFVLSTEAHSVVPMTLRLSWLDTEMIRLMTYRHLRLEGRYLINFWGCMRRSKSEPRRSAMGREGAETSPVHTKSQLLC